MTEVEITRSNIHIIFSGCPDPIVCLALEIFYWLGKCVGDLLAE